MGNNQAKNKSEQSRKEFRRRRSFNPNSEKRQKALSVSPNIQAEKKNDLSIEQPYILAVSQQLPKQNINVATSSHDKKAEISMNSQRLKDKSQILDTSQQVAASVRRSASRSKNNSSELILSKYLLPNKQNKKKKEPLIVNKYFDGNLIDKKVIHDISQQHLNNTIHYDISNDSLRESRRSRTPLSQRLGFKGQNSYSFSSFQKEIETLTSNQIKQRKKRESRWKAEDDMNDCFEFMAMYRLCSGMFLEKEVSLIQPTLITFNQDLLEPFSQSSQTKGIRQTFGPQQNDLELQKYLQFLNSLECTAVSSFNFMQLVKERDVNKNFYPIYGKSQLQNSIITQQIIPNNQNSQIENKNKGIQPQNSKQRDEMQDNEQQFQKQLKQEGVIQNQNEKDKKSQQDNKLPNQLQDNKQILQLQDNKQMLQLRDNKSMHQLKDNKQMNSLNQLQKQIFDQQSIKFLELQEEYSSNPSFSSPSPQKQQQQQTSQQLEKFNSQSQPLPKQIIPSFEISYQQSPPLHNIENKSSNSKDNLEKELINQPFNENIITHPKGFCDVSSIIIHNSQTDIDQKDNRVPAQPIKSNMQLQPLEHEKEKASSSPNFEQNTINQNSLLPLQINNLPSFKPTENNIGDNNNSQIISAVFPSTPLEQEKDNLNTTSLLKQHFIPNYQYNMKKQVKYDIDPFSQSQNQFNSQQEQKQDIIHEGNNKQTFEGKIPTITNLKDARQPAGRGMKFDQYDDEIKKKEMEMQLIDKRLEIIQESNYLLTQQRRDKSQNQRRDTSFNHNNQDGGERININNYSHNKSFLNNPDANRSFASPQLSGNSMSQTKLENKSPKDFYKLSYFNQNLYSQQHKAKRDSQISSYSQMLFPSSNSNQLKQSKASQSINSSNLNRSELQNRNFEQEEEERNQQKQQNLQNYYNQKKELQKEFKIKEKEQKLQKKLFQKEEEDEKEEIESNDSENRNNFYEEFDEIKNYSATANPIEVQINLQDFKKNQTKQQPPLQEGAIPIEIDIQQFVKKRQSTIDIQNQNPDLKRLTSNAESEGEQILKSITKQVISLKGRIEKDKKELDESNISYQTKIVNKALSTVNNSYQNLPDDKLENNFNSSLPDLSQQEQNSFLNHHPSAQEVSLQQEFILSPTKNRPSSQKDIKSVEHSGEKLDTHSSGDLTQNQFSQYSTIPGNYDPYQNLKSQGFGSHQQIDSLQTEDDQKGFPMSTQSSGQQNKSQNEKQSKNISHNSIKQIKVEDTSLKPQQFIEQESASFFESSPAQFVQQPESFIDPRFQRQQQQQYQPQIPQYKNQSGVNSVVSSLHDGYGLNSEFKGINNIVSSHSSVNSAFQIPHKQFSFQGQSSIQQSLSSQVSSQPKGYNLFENARLSNELIKSQNDNNSSSKKSSLKIIGSQGTENNYKANKSNSQKQIQSSMMSSQKSKSSKQNQNSNETFNKLKSSSQSMGKNSSQEGSQKQKSTPRTSSLRSSDANFFFNLNQDPVQQNQLITDEDDDLDFIPMGGDIKKSYQSKEGFDFKMFDSIGQEQSYQESSEDQNYPAQIKIDLNQFKKR